MVVNLFVKCIDVGAQGTLVTVEEIRDIDLMQDEALAGGSLPALYVTAIAEAPRGAWPS